MALELHVNTRSATGRKTQSLRRSGTLPGVVYGHGMDSTAVQMSPSEFGKVYRGAGTSSLIDVRVDDGAPFKALIQDVQAHLLHLHPTHVDLRRINMNEEFEVAVPFRFVGESPAVKEQSGTLVRNMQEVTVRCLPANLPSELVVDITKLATFDDVVKMKDIELPAGVTVELDAECAIASVTPPLTEEQLKKLEEAGTADVSAIEVTGEKKEGEEGESEAAAEGATDEKKSVASES